MYVHLILLLMLSLHSHQPHPFINERYMGVTSLMFVNCSLSTMHRMVFTGLIKIALSSYIMFSNQRM